MKISKFTKIDLELLLTDTVLGFDLYLKSHQEYILYRSHRIPFDDRVRQNLLSHGVKSLHILTRDQSKYKSYIENNLTSILADPEIKTDVKRKVVYQNSLNIARNLIADPTSPKAVKRSARAVENIVELHIKDKEGLKKIIYLMPEDYKIYSHSANVATYCIALGISLGIFNKKELYELGFGAFLHDIGKSRIPREILDKPSHLTSEEFEVVKGHVHHGRLMVEGNPLVPRRSILPISFHHERLSGDGYPGGKRGDEIPISGLITAVADAFDAMTTNRIYQKALTTFKAIQILLADENNYDRRIIFEMIKLLGPDKMADRQRQQDEMVKYDIHDKS